MKFFKKAKFDSIRIYFFVITLYLSFNFLVLNGKNDRFSDIDTYEKILGLIFAIAFLIFLLNTNIKFFNYGYPLLFLLYGINNIFDIPIDYFWSTIPDSRTYATLGKSLLECGKLALDCRESPYLIFPIGQPLFSGLIYKYVYNFGPYINVLLITYTIFIVSKIIKFHTGSNKGIGLSFILIHSLVYELTPMIISEVTFTFLIIIFIYYFFTKSKNSFTVPIIYSVATLVRPIGIALFPIIFLLTKNKKRLILVLITVIMSAAIFNFLTAQKFVVSEFKVNAQEDGFVDNSNYVDYFIKIFSFDSETRSDFVSYIGENFSRLYGESSKECSFIKACNVYNPMYNFDGTESSYFKNSNSGNYISKFMTTIYKLQGPQGVFVFLLPVILICSLIFFKDKNIMFYTFSIIFLIIPSIITSEYGSRFNYPILFLTGILIELLNCKFKNIFKYNIYR